MRWSRGAAASGHAGTAVAIRCTGPGPDVDRVAAFFADALPDAEIWFVADRRGAGTARRFPDEGRVIALTDRWLDEAGLFHARTNVGWRCGDYAYYAALDRPWDHLWLAEPDIAFQGDARAIIREAERSDAALIGTRISRRGRAWRWSRALEAVEPNAQTWGMLFPLSRVSRPFAVTAFESRVAMTPRLAVDEGLAVPNDEVFVASMAKTGGYGTLDLAATYPDAFRSWGWQVRHCLEELSDETAIVHPALSRDDLVRALVDEAQAALAKGRFNPTMAAVSADLRAAVLDHVLAGYDGPDQPPA
ncbi:hypothetical protein GCM10028801_40750 [Nocardioides maradonensis]